MSCFQRGRCVMGCRDASLILVRIVCKYELLCIPRLSAAPVAKFGKNPLSLWWDEASCVESKASDPSDFRICLRVREPSETAVHVQHRIPTKSASSIFADVSGSRWQQEKILGRLNSSSYGSARTYCSRPVPAVSGRQFRRETHVRQQNCHGCL